MKPEPSEGLPEWASHYAQNQTLHNRLFLKLPFSSPIFNNLVKYKTKFQMMRTIFREIQIQTRIDTNELKLCCCIILFQIFERNCVDNMLG